MKIIFIKPMCWNFADKIRKLHVKNCVFSSPLHWINWKTVCSEFCLILSIFLWFFRFFSNFIDFYWFSCNFSLMGRSQEIIGLLTLACPHVGWELICSHAVLAEYDALRILHRKHSSSAHRRTPTSREQSYRKPWKKLGWARNAWLHFFRDGWTLWKKVAGNKLTGNPVKNKVGRETHYCTFSAMGGPYGKK